MGLLLSVLLNVPALFAQSPCEVKIGRCEYYACVSREMSCSKDDYLLSFGEKNCRRFYTLEPYLTQKGVEFTRRSRLCLQKKIAEEKRMLTCQRSSAMAKEHHVACYVSEGYCDLSARDRLVIVGSVLKDILSDRNLREAGVEIQDACRHLKQLQVSH